MFLNILSRFLIRFKLGRWNTILKFNSSVTRDNLLAEVPRTRIAFSRILQHKKTRSLLKRVDILIFGKKMLSIF